MLTMTLIELEGSDEKGTFQTPLSCCSKTLQLSLATIATQDTTHLQEYACIYAAQKFYFIEKSFI